MSALPGVSKHCIKAHVMGMLCWAQLVLPDKRMRFLTETVRPLDAPPCQPALQHPLLMVACHN